MSGKGGSGKTTISGTLARLAGRAGRAIIAIDADTNPNLALTLGLPREAFDAAVPLPHGLLEHKRVNGDTQLRLSRPLDEVTAEYTCHAPDNVHLLMVGQVRGAGTG